MKDKVILIKILKYIQEIEEFIDGYSEEQFKNDRKTINACVFNLSQIGELTSKISNETLENNSHIEWRGLKGLRNRIVHDYDGVNLNMVWEFLKIELPELDNEVMQIVNNME